MNDYRLIGLDTNYFYMDSTKSWGRLTSLFKPEGSSAHDSLSPAQLNWLYEVIKDAHEKGKKVLTFSHAAFLDFTHSQLPDAEGNKLKTYDQGFKERMGLWCEAF